MYRKVRKELFEEVFVIQYVVAAAPVFMFVLVLHGLYCVVTSRKEGRGSASLCNLTYFS